MGTEENKTIVRTWMEKGWNEHNEAVVDDLFAPEFVLHGFAANREEWREFFTSFIKAVPDVHVAVDDQVAEGDKVVTRWTMRGTHKGELMGVAAKGNRFEITGMNICRFENGKYVEDWGNWDEKGLMDQIQA